LINQTFNQQALDAYLNHRTGPYTKAQGSSAAFLTLEMITNQASSMINTLINQNPTDYLPAAYKASKQLVAGFVAQRAILAAQLRLGQVAMLEFPFSGSGSVPNALQKPLSRGTITLNATNPHGEPAVLYGAFTNPFDKMQLGASVRWTRKVFADKNLAYLNPVELTPGPSAQSDDQIFNGILTAQSPFGGSAIAPTFAHPSCSCPMMPQILGGVVDPTLQVYGTKKLSIVDCSIIPIIPAAHLQATMYAVAEKAADLIKARA
jgi:choline dehydrogenase-like flavoprotein